jgi:hypothetical protein
MGVRCHLVKRSRRRKFAGQIPHPLENGSADARSIYEGSKGQGLKVGEMLHQVAGELLSKSC